MLSPAVSTIALWAFCVDWVSATSLPVFCEGVTCEEGFVCMVRAQAPCTPRFCPPPVGACVPISTRPGVCPNRLENPDCLSLRGVPLCQLDEDCLDGKKCCDGCCKTPDAVEEHSNLPVTPGMCPREGNLNLLRFWTALHCPNTDTVDECRSDQDCHDLEIFKCCTTLCGNKCKRALSVSLPVAK